MTQQGAPRSPASAVKLARALSRRAVRDEHGLCLVEGIRHVAEAALAGRVDTLLVAPALLTSDFARRVVDDQRAAGVDVVETSPDTLRSIASRENPQGIVAIARQRWEELRDLPAAAGLCWLALDAVQDPGNLGTILRTSAAVGGAGAILLGPSTDPYHSSAVRASMGALFRQRLVRATFGELAAWSRRGGASLVGATVDAATSYRDAHYAFPLVLLMGSEREGLSAAQAAACDLTVSIPMAPGGVDSLNLAVATGVILYEIFHRARAI